MVIDMQNDLFVTTPFDTLKLISRLERNEGKQCKRMKKGEDYLTDRKQAIHQLKWYARHFPSRKSVEQANALIINERQKSVKLSVYLAYSWIAFICFVFGVSWELIG